MSRIALRRIHAFCSLWLIVTAAPAAGFTTLHELTFDLAINAEPMPLLIKEETGCVAGGMAVVSRFANDGATVLVKINDPDCGAKQVVFKAFVDEQIRDRHGLYTMIHEWEVSLALAVDLQDEKTARELQAKISDLKEKLASGKPVVILPEGSVSLSVSRNSERRSDQTD